MTLVYQCTVSVIIPRYTVFGRILVTLTFALNKAKARNTRPSPNNPAWGYKTPEPIHLKSGMCDYVNSPTTRAKYGGRRKCGVGWAYG